MREMIIKCVRISFIGWQNKENWKLHSMKVQGVGLIVCDFLNTAYKVNENINKDIIEINDMEELIINEDDSIKIVSVPNKKEIRMAVYDSKNNLAIGVTFLSNQKIEFTDLDKFKSKYTT